MTATNLNGWTTSTLKEHLKTVLDEREKRYDDKFAAKTELGRMAEQATQRALDLAARDRESEFAHLERALDRHCVADAEDTAEQEKKQDLALQGLRDQMAVNAKLLVGALVGGVAALLMALVDVLTRVM